MTEFDPFREQKEKSFHDSVEQMKTTGQQLLDWTAEKHEVAEIEKQFKHFLSVRTHKIIAHITLSPKTTNFISSLGPSPFGNKEWSGQTN